MQTKQEHQVLFYDHESFLIEKVAGFLAQGLKIREGLIISAREDHWEQLQRKLMVHGHDAHALVESGQIFYLSPKTVVRELIHGKTCNEEHFRSLFLPRIMGLKKNFSMARVYAELVDMLVEEEQHELVIKIEDYWNKLHEEQRFSQLCSYSLSNLSQPFMEETFDQICRHHDSILDIEDAPREDNFLVAKFLQRARALSSLEKKSDELTKFAALGEMSAGIAHEMNNPLAVTLTVLDCLSEKLKDDPDLLKLVQMGHKSTDKLASIVQNIRLYTRKSTPELKQMNLTESVVKVVEAQKADLKKLGIDLTLECDGQFIIQGESFALEQAIMNFIHFSRDAIRSKPHRDPGRIGLKLDSDQPGIVELKIIDNGLGLTSEAQGRLFTPFHATKEETYGHGLGIYMAYTVLKQHEAQVEMHSERGMGTTFVFTFRCDRTM